MLETKLNTTEFIVLTNVLLRQLLITNNDIGRRHLKKMYDIMWCSDKCPVILLMTFIIVINTLDVHELYYAFYLFL